MGKLQRLCYILIGLLMGGYAALSVVFLYFGALPFTAPPQMLDVLAFGILPVGAGMTFIVGLYLLLRGLFSRRRYHGITSLQEDGAVYITEKALAHAIRAAVEDDAPDVLATRVKLRIRNRRGEPDYSAKVRIRLQESSRNLDERGNYLREKIANDLMRMIGHPIRRIDIIFHQVADKKKEGDAS